MLRVALLVVLPLAFALPSAFAQGAADFPNRPVRLISDSSPGSAVDTALRIIADGMSRRWREQVVLVNHPGAAGIWGRGRSPD